MTAIEAGATGAFDRGHGRVAHWTRVLCVLFFFSGFPALIYQLTWQRALFRIFGVNIESVTIIVAAFMLGLGIGSLAGGWLSQRSRIALLPLLAGIELATGAFGAVSLFVFDYVGALTAAWPLAATSAVTLALVIVPTLLMGATLPLLVGHLVRGSGQVGTAVGLLYYVNTLGAGAACFACTVLFFPFLGMHGSVAVAVAINCAVAAGALLAYRRMANDASHAEPCVPAASAARPAACGFLAVLALALAGGFLSLSYEIFFFRTVSYASGSSATAFAITLGAFLLGVASGSREASTNCATLAREAIVRRAATAMLAANLVGLLFLPLLSHLAWLDRGIMPVAILMVYLVARFWGTLLPYLAELGIAADGKAGMRTALLYLANILGSAAGSILTGFFLMDHMGILAIAVTLVVAGSLCTAVFMWLLNLPRGQRYLRTGVAAAVGALSAFLIPGLAEHVLENLQWKGAAEAKPFLDVVETRSGIIAVDADGTVFGHGMYDGRFNTDLRHDTNGIVRPYAISLFHAAPRRVLMIGLSSGSWAQVIANNPHVESLTVVEINPGYQKLIARAPEVASVLVNPKVHIVTDDGRRWLRRNSHATFDVVVSNTTWHFRANAANLLSAEFLDLIGNHLEPNGVFFYNTTDASRVQRTGCLRVAHGARFSNHLLVSAAPIDWNFQRWRQVLEAYQIDGKPVLDASRAADRAVLDRLMAIEANLLPGAVTSAESAIELCRDIVARTAGKPIVSDDNMGSEWRYSLGLQ